MVEPAECRTSTAEALPWKGSSLEDSLQLPHHLRAPIDDGAVGRLRDRVLDVVPPRSLTPLFWLKGDPPERLVEEIERMDAAGMAGFIVEARPHPDFLGEAWWGDLDLIFEQAAARGMKVWLFDDSHYPSGYAAGVVAREQPELTRRLVAIRRVDVQGPLPYAQFDVEGWLHDDESPIAVVAMQRESVQSRFEPARYEASSRVDLTDDVSDGRVRWAVPQGSWSVFSLVVTRDGGEAKTRDYIDPLREDAVDAYLEAVHAPIVERYSRFIGPTFQGFFTDEPRFGNFPSYASLPGGTALPWTGGLSTTAPDPRFVATETPSQPLPWSPDLLRMLSSDCCAEVRSLLPALWYDCGAETRRVRLDYMNVITRQFADGFLRRIGDWCRDRGLRLIGHVIEENGAHAHIGYGAGHYFRAMAALDGAGCDIVLDQIHPDVPPDRSVMVIGSGNGGIDHDARFIRFGLVQLTASAADQCEREPGLTLCEAFGAYGWSEGLALMKWLTDWLCVRGVNFIVPHAFSPAPFPDSDCPPHFWANGNNPQWRFFRHWADYANRLCALLSGGHRVQDVLVLYPAESEWIGWAEPVDSVVETLGHSQLNAMIISYDDFTHCAAVGDGVVEFVGREYGAVVLPEVEYVPAPVAAGLSECAAAGVAAICVERAPRALDDDTFSELNVLVCARARLGEHLRALGVGTVSLADHASGVRHLHYRVEGAQVVFFFNESRSEAADTVATVAARGVVERWNLAERRAEAVDVERADAATVDIAVRLAPNETAVFVIDPQKEPTIAAAPSPDLRHVAVVEGSWSFAVADATAYPRFGESRTLVELGDWTAEHNLARFSGTGRYATTFVVPPDAPGLTLDLGAVFEVARVEIDGGEVGTRIAPPYRFGIEGLLPGEHELVVEVTNTLGTALRDRFSAGMPLTPSGLLGPVRLTERVQRSRGSDRE